MNSAKIIQGESKGLPFLIKSRLTGQVVNVSTSTCLLYLKANPGDPSPILMKPDAAFDKSNGAAGKLNVTLTPQDTFLPPFVYYGELRVAVSGGAVYKMPFELEIMLSETTWVISPPGIPSQEAFGVPVVS